MKRVVPLPFPTDTRVEDSGDLGQAIRAARTQAGLSLQDAALILDMAVKTLFDLEAGKPGVSIGKILHAAHGLGVDLFVIPRRHREAMRHRLDDLE